MVAALLARDLGIPVQPPLVVSVGSIFGTRLSGHVGLCFGTEKWPPGFGQWQPGFHLTPQLRQTLAEILIFDCVIQNIDRRKGNPNCAVRNEDAIPFDHELAFSNLVPHIL
jgi:hypothetical protein